METDEIPFCTCSTGFRLLLWSLTEEYLKATLPLCFVWVVRSGAISAVGSPNGTFPDSTSLPMLLKFLASGVACSLTLRPCSIEFLSAEESKIHQAVSDRTSKRRSRADFSLKKSK
jgi:hypothetical protein